MRRSGQCIGSVEVHLERFRLFQGVIDRLGLISPRVGLTLAKTQPSGKAGGVGKKYEKGARSKEERQSLSLGHHRRSGHHILFQMHDLIANP